MVGAGLRQQLLLPFSGRIARNRVLKSATSERLATFDPENTFDRGKPTDELINLFRVWGQGEIGIIVTGNIMVHRSHIESAGAIILDQDILTDYTPSLRRLARAAKAHGSLLIGQLSHPGRQTSWSLQPHPVSASDVRLVLESGGGPVRHGKPRPLLEGEIHELVTRFVWAARVLYRAGFDGVQVSCSAAPHRQFQTLSHSTVRQIHAAHGYLIGQFLSPRTNHRTDPYGGSLHNRARLLYEIVQAVRDAIPDQRFVIAVKINVDDFVEGGFSLEDSLQVAQQLETLRADLIELSGGTYEGWRFHHTSETSREREGFFLEESLLFKKRLRTTLVAATGGFRSMKKMEEALRRGSVDVVGLGIPLCGEPHLIKNMFSGVAQSAKPNLLPGAVEQMAAAAQQLKAVANGEEPAEYTTEDAVKFWLANAPSAH